MDCQDCHLEASEIRACSLGLATLAVGEHILAGIQEKQLVPAAVELASTEVPAAVVVAVAGLDPNRLHNLLPSSVVADRGLHPVVAFQDVVADRLPESEQAVAAFLAGCAAAVHWTEEPVESEMQGVGAKTQLGNPVEVVAAVAVGAHHHNQDSRGMLAAAAADVGVVADAEDVAEIVVADDETAGVVVADKCFQL